MKIYVAYDGKSEWITKTASRYTDCAITQENYFLYPVRMYLNAIISELEKSQNYELVKLASKFVGKMQKVGVSDETIKKMLFDWLTEEE